MLTAAGCAGRRKRLWASLPGHCDTLVLADPKSLVYFANYFPSEFVFRSCDAGAILILTPDKATLVADKMVHVYLDEAHVDEVVAPVWYDGKHSAPHRLAQLVASALDQLQGIKGTRYGLEAASVPAGVMLGLESFRAGADFVPLEPTVRRLRRAKDADELALLQRSVVAGEAGHAAAMAGIQPGMTELDAYNLVAQACNLADHDQLLTYGDFASGPRVSTDRGGPPQTGRKIEAGDLFLLDYSVIVRGYRADFTNTWVVAGTPTAEQERLFEACMAGLAAGEAALKAGALGRDIDAAVRKPIRDRGLEEYYKSHSGHGLGLSHPEPPYLVAESTDALLADDIVALEPGLFIPGVAGMRFEHNYRITPTGYEQLTHHRLTLSP